MWRTTTTAGPAAASRSDLIGRDFTTDPAAVDIRWCGDIFYMNTRQGWLYRGTVIDLASRRVVGWAIIDHRKTDLVDAPLSDALTQRRPADGVAFHSAAVKYTGAQHARLATAHGIRLSTSQRGHCEDNAFAESFFATIKTELLASDLARWALTSQMSGMVER